MNIVRQSWSFTNDKMFKLGSKEIPNIHRCVHTIISGKMTFKIFKFRADFKKVIRRTNTTV